MSAPDDLGPVLDDLLRLRVSLTKIYERLTDIHEARIWEARMDAEEEAGEAAATVELLVEHLDTYDKWFTGRMADSEWGRWLADYYDRASAHVGTYDSSGGK